MATTAATTTVNWEWMDDAGAWEPYHHLDNLLIETAFQSAKGTGAEFKTKDLSFNAGYDSLYVFDFKKKTQTNTESGRVRKLRRIETGADDGEEMGFVAMVKATSFKLTTGTAPTVSPPLGSKTAKPTAAGSDTDEDEAPPAKKLKADGTGTGGTPSKVADPGVTPAPPVAASSTTSTTSATSISYAAVPPVADKTIAEQVALGAQSRRKQGYNLGPVGKDPHAKNCFDKMLSREKQLCGEWAVFYHSYSFAALLYEVQAAVAAVLFRFKSEFATLPRLLKAPFRDLPDVEALLKLFPKMPSRDHDPRFRGVAISGTSALLAPDSEAPPTSVFLHGYSCADLSFFGVLESLLESCGVPTKMKTEMAKKIVELSGTHGLDVSQFKGKPCKSGRSGHMLQIFVKRSIVDKYVYAALPFGVPDKKRHPNLEQYLEGPGPISGQVRVVMNPSVFMRGSAVRMYVCSADPSFHANRPNFQKELSALLQPIIGTPEVRTKAAEGIYDGKLPAWFNADDYEAQKEKKAKEALAAAAATTAPDPAATAAAPAPATTG
jgi:hypothetical protein